MVWSVELGYGVYCNTRRFYYITFRCYSECIFLYKYTLLYSSLLVYSFRAEDDSAVSEDGALPAEGVCSGVECSVVWGVVWCGV